MQPTIDIEVTGNHLFYANDILTHNSSSDPGLEDTSESFGLPATADLMFALITSEDLEALGQIMVKQLKNRYNADLGSYLDYGIHVMVSQNERGELTVGDTHEYAHTFDPFDKANLNNLVIDYLKTFANKDNWNLVESWHGVYPKMTNSATELILHPSPNVYIINGLGGNGMTLSFGLAEETIAHIL